MLLNKNININSNQKRLYDVLVEMGKLNSKDTHNLKLLNNQELETKLNVDSIVSNQDINQAYAKMYDLEFVSLKDKKIPKEVLNLIPEKLSIEYKIISFE